MHQPGITKAGEMGKFSLFLAAIALGTPFVIVFLYTKGLSGGLSTAFSYDESKYHYPVILQFAKDLPFPDLTNYNSATTPLFHLLFAVLSKIVGTDIQHLRMINFFITVFSTILLFKLLIKQFNLPYFQALLSTSLFALSPYFFREAFVVMTDNLPVLWLLLFFQYYLRFKEDGRMRNYLYSIFFIMLLCLTRQTYLYIVLPVAADIYMNKGLKQSWAVYMLLLVLAIAPTLLLFFTWKGLTPPQFQERHTEASLLNIKPALYGLGVVGFYSLFIAGDKIYRTFLSIPKQKVLAAVLLGWALLFFFPLTKANHDFGYLWYIADELPSVHGTPVLFYILVAIGICVSSSIWQIETAPFYFLFIIGLFISEIPNKYFFQRYYDSSILIFLIFLDARYDKSDRFQVARIGLLTCLFILYFIVFIIR
jgi:hypothetical protein